MDNIARTIRQELVPVLIVGTLLLPYVWLVMRQVPVPTSLENLIVMVVAFYFQGKVQQIIRENGHEVIVAKADRVAIEGSHDGSSSNP